VLWCKDRLRKKGWEEEVSSVALSSPDLLHEGGSRGREEKIKKGSARGKKRGRKSLSSEGKEKIGYSYPVVPKRSRGGALGKSGCRHEFRARWWRRDADDWG